MIFVSGQTALDENAQIVGKGDIEAQARQSFENIKRILESEGGKMSDVVIMTFYCKDIRSLRRGELFAGVLKEYFGPVCALVAS
jgi:enamine deaminase RidA (YjgF/YER057c/UK114 family)